MPGSTQVLITMSNGQMGKLCKACNKTKSLNDYYPNNNNRFGVLPLCKPCTLERNKRLVKPETRYRSHRSRVLKSFGLTFVKYGIMLQKQNGVCAICGDKDNNSSLHVDHDHKTNKVRGLLCKRCNSGIGMFKESLDIIRHAVQYLENHLAEGEDNDTFDPQSLFD